MTCREFTEFPIDHQDEVPEELVQAILAAKSRGSRAPTGS